MTINDLHVIMLRITGELRNDIQNLRANDIFHLEQKVDRLTWFMGIGVGIITATQIIMHFIK